jgi:hypothetical protein
MCIYDPGMRPQGGFLGLQGSSGVLEQKCINTIELFCQREGCDHFRVNLSFAHHNLLRLHKILCGGASVIRIPSTEDTPPEPYREWDVHPGATKLLLRRTCHSKFKLHCALSHPDYRRSLTVAGICLLYWLHSPFV